MCLLFGTHCIVFYLFSPFLLSFQYFKELHYDGPPTTAGLRSDQQFPSVDHWFTKLLFVFGANRRSMRMACFLTKMRYMETKMRDGHAWSGSEVTAQF